MGMEERVSSQFVRSASLIATVLDPRFKRLRQLPKEMRPMAWDLLRNALIHEAKLQGTHPLMNSLCYVRMCP